MPGVLITIFTIIGIIFACIGGFIVFAAVTPFTYRADVSYHGSPNADVRASWLLGFLRIFVSYAGDKPRVLVKLLFFTVFDSSKPKKKKRKRKLKKGKKISKRSLRKKKQRPDEDKDDTEAFDIEEESDAPETLKGKFIAVMDKVTAFIKGALKKADAFAQWLDADHRRLYGFLWTNGLKIFKKVKPKVFEADISGGTGDPSSTGMIVSAASIGLGLAGIDTVRIEPDFENKGIDAQVLAAGHFFVFPVIFLALKIYRNKDFRRFILKKG